MHVNSHFEIGSTVFVGSRTIRPLVGSDLNSWLVALPDMLDPVPTFPVSALIRSWFSKASRRTSRRKFDSDNQERAALRVRSR
jgi:hypothetical protein